MRNTSGIVPLSCIREWLSDWTRVCFLPVLVSLIVALIAVRAESDEIELGKITVSAVAPDQNIGGPLRLDTNVNVIFREFLRDKQISMDVLTEAEFSRLVADYHLVLVEERDREQISYAQWEPQESWDEAGNWRNGSLVWLPNMAVVPSKHRVFELVMRPGQLPSPFQVDDVDQTHLLVNYRGRSVLRYNYAIVRQRPGQDGDFDRGCYIHPVWTPTGHVVTGDFSPEHVHQRGIFLAWKDVKFGDVETDFWSLGSAAGRLVSGKYRPRIIVGLVFAKLILANDGMVSGKVMFHETVEVTVYAGEIERGWMFDVRTRQRPTKGGPAMHLPQVYYGGMSFRGPSGWLSKDSRDVVRALARGESFEPPQWLPTGIDLDVLTSGRNDRTTGDRTRAAWIDYTGPLDGQWGGVAMFDHPSNARYPTPLRIHPELPYFNYAFVQRRPYTIHHEAPLEVVYRIHVHDGHPDAELNGRIATQFASASRVAWQGESNN